MTNIQVNSQGYQYHESSQPSVDPSKVNDFSKKSETTEQKSHPDIERKAPVWNEIWGALSQHKIPEQVQTNSHQDINAQHQDLVHQCNVLKDLVQGMIVGDRNTLAQEQQYNYIQQISSILKDLSDIEMSQQYRQLAHSVKFQQNNNQQIQKQLQETINKIQQKKQQSETQTALIEVPVQDSNKNLLTSLEKRLQRIEKYIGINQFTQVGKVRDFTLNYKGLPIITSSNFLESKTLTFVPQDALTQTTYILQTPQPDPMPILQHIKYLQTAVDIINDNTTLFNNFLTSEEPTPDISQAIEIGKKYELQLVAGDEIPQIVERLQSLKSLHDDSVILPEDIERTQKDLMFMEFSLQETEQLLDLLDKDVTENIIILKENISKLKL